MAGGRVRGRVTRGPDSLKTRLLHPSFFTDEKVRQLSPNAKLLLQGLWLRADDYGRAIYLPKLIEGEVFPTEQVDIYSLLNEIVNQRLIRIYEVGGQVYYDVPSWEKWQNPKYKAKSPIPEYPEDIGEESGEIEDKPGTNESGNGENLAPVLGLGLLFEKGLEGVPEPSQGNLRQFWRRQREEQRREGG